jgi:hypothetical protein
MIGIDLVLAKDFRRQQNAEHGDADRNRFAQGMQEVGMADQHRGTGIPQDVADFLRLEVPVDGDAIGAKPHRGIGNFQEDDVVAHEDADAVALPDAQLLQPARDAGGAIGNLGMITPALAADDAEEERGSIGHCLIPERYSRFVVITGLVPVIHVLLSLLSQSEDVDGRNKSGHDDAQTHTSEKRGARFSMLARTASS